MSILSLIYRTAGAWGAGKGSNLTAAEVDENFYDIEQAVNDLTENPVQPVQIENITIDGQTLTITMDNAATYEVEVPTAPPQWRGDWAAETDYETADLFEATVPATGIKGLYFTNRPFTSGTTFDPTLGTGVGGVLPYASFVLAVPNRVRVAWFWPTKPGQGLPILESSGDFAPMFSFLTVDSFVLPADLTGSVANLRTAPNDTLSFTIRVNGVDVGSLSFAGGSFTPVFTFPDAVGLVAGDVLTMEGPDPLDDLAECLSVTLVGTLGELADSSSS